MTQGDDMQNAYEMAVDARGLAISSRKKERLEIPPPGIITEDRRKNLMVIYKHI